MLRAALTLIVISLSVPSWASDDAKTRSGSRCTETRFGACRVVHGRYGIYVEANGIWDIRTSRLMTTGGDADLDQIIYNAGGSFDHEILGDFTVCPLSKMENPAQTPTKAWQAVCVQSFKNTKLVKRRWPQ
jgi:hypothetical protein